MIKITPNFTQAKKADNRSSFNGQNYLLNKPMNDSVNFGEVQNSSNNRQPIKIDDNFLGWVFLGVGLVIAGVAVSRAIGDSTKVAKEISEQQQKDFEAARIAQEAKKRVQQASNYVNNYVHTIIPKRNNSIGRPFVENPSEFVRSDAFKKLRNRTCSEDFLHNLYEALKTQNEKENSLEIQKDIVTVLNKLEAVRAARRKPQLTKVEKIKLKTQQEKIKSKNPTSKNLNLKPVKPKRIITQKKVDYRLNEEADIAIDLSNVSLSQEAREQNRLWALASVESLGN